MSTSLTFSTTSETSASTMENSLIPNLTTTRDAQHVLTAAYAARKIVVLYFTMKGCGPCREIWPTVEALAHEFSGTIQFYRVGGSPELMNHFKIMSVPTFIFVVQNRVVHIQTGADADALRRACHARSAATATAAPVIAAGAETGMSSGARGAEEDVTPVSTFF